MKNTRLIALNDGTGMGDSVIIFTTNAPIERLKALEKESCEIYSNGRNPEDIPIWTEILSDEGYIFDFVDEHTHITPYASSKEWLESKYGEIKEHYTINHKL